MHFAAELEAKPAYAMIRLIGVDDNQREIVRVDRSGPGGAVRVVPDAELQERGDRSYFKETIRLSPGQIYVSPVKLDHSDGGDAAHTDAARRNSDFRTGRQAIRRSSFVNVDMRPGVRAHPVDGPARSTDLCRQFPGRLSRPPRSHARIRLAARQARPTGRRLSGAGACARKRRKAARSCRTRPDGRAEWRFAPAMLAGSEWIGVIETVPERRLHGAGAGDPGTPRLLVGLIAVLCAAALAAIVARSLTRPIKQLTVAVEGHRPQRSAPIPVDASGETGVLARAFARMLGEANAKTAALEREIQEHRRTEAARDHLRGTRAAVQRRRGVVERRHRHQIARRDDHRLESGRGTPVRIYRGGGGRQEYRSDRALRPGGRRCRRSCVGSRGRERSNTTRRCGYARMAARSRCRCRSHRSGRRPARSSVHRRPHATLPRDSRTEQALRQQIEERRRIFESSQDLILIIDSTGVLVQVSPSSETILGYPPEEMIGHRRDRIHHPDDLESTRKEMRAARRGRIRATSPVRYRPQGWPNGDAVVDG